MSEIRLFTKPFSGEEFFNNIIKKQFSQATDEKLYYRIPYDHWKILKENILPIDIILVEFWINVDKDPIIVKICQKKNNNLTVLEKYSSDDGSLGQFLYERYFPKEEVFMPSNDTTTVINSSNLSSGSIQSNYGSLTYSDRTDGTVSNSMDGYSNISLSYDGYAMQSKVSELEKDVSQLKKTVNAEKTQKGKEDKMTGLNFDFGPCTGDNIRMSMYGLAVKNASGTWVSYNKDSRQIIDVDILNFDGSRFMFKMPVAIKDIQIGDIVVHNRVPMFITEIDDCGKLFAVDVRAGEEKCIIPTRNMFGFDFVTKIVSLFDAIGSAPSPDQPFGNMLPLLLAGSENGDGIDPMTMLLLTQGGNGIDTSNPLLLYALLKDRGDTDSLLPLLLLGGNK